MVAPDTFDLAAVIAQDRAKLLRAAERWAEFAARVDAIIAEQQAKRAAFGKGSE